MSLSTLSLNHGLTELSIPEAQSVGMTAFQRLWDAASNDYFRDKMAQSVGTTGVEGFSGGYRASGRR